MSVEILSTWLGKLRHEALKMGFSLVELRGDGLLCMNRAGVRIVYDQAYVYGEAKVMLTIQKRNKTVVRRDLVLRAHDAKTADPETLYADGIKELQKIVRKATAVKP